MTDRNYNQDEIDILKDYYGGTDDDWSAYLLKPDGDYVPLFDQGTILTAPSGDIYYDSDSRYSDNYSQFFFSGSLNVSSVADARKVHAFLHEAFHQVQERAMSDGQYISYVGRDAGKNYNYEEIFNGTPFYKLSAEQQAEYLTDRIIIKELNELGGGIDPQLKADTLADMLDKGARYGGTVGSYSEAQYDAVMPSDLQAEIEKYIAFKHAQDFKDLNGAGGQARPAGDDDDGETATKPNGGESWIDDEVKEKFDDSESRGSPLVLDLDGDGVELSSLNSAGAVYFDIDSAKDDGVAEATGWITGDDGFLAIDLNENGIINNADELFGNQTGHANGFLALATYDGNQDGLITQADAIWDDLRIWTEDSQDGISEAHELHTLDDLLITEIDLGYSDTSSTIAGNDILQESTFTIDGNTRDIVDVYFSYSDHNTINNSSFEFDYRTLGLPDQRGFGELPDLYIAVSLDNDDQDPDSLISLATDLADTTFANIFDETTDLLADVKDIMFRWAGVDSLTGTERGQFVDSRELGFLEKMMGTPFVQRDIWSNPQGAEAGEDINEAFHIALNNVYARLVAQSAGGELFTGDWYYDIASDSFSGITGLDSTNLSALETEATNLSTTGEREVFWSNVLRMVEFSVGVTNLPGADQTALSDAITDSDASLSMSTLIDDLDYARDTGVDETYTSGNDTENGSSADDILRGEAGDDDLSGLAGSDVIHGGADDDVLNGGADGDYLLGGTGEDTYEWSAGDGHDTIKESETGTGNDNDKILLGAGFDSGDLTLTRAGNTDLLIELDNGSDTGQIIIEDHFNYAAGGGHVELIEFNDTSTYDLDGQNWTLTGTAGNDTLWGVKDGVGGLGQDTIYGGDGNDIIRGYAPNETDNNTNTLYGEDGNDELYGGNVADTIYGGADDDYLDGGAGADTLDGGAGDDELIGGTGDDVFVYVSGHDTIDENGGADEIQLDAAWDSITPDYFRIGNDLQVFWDTDNSITIEGFYADSLNEVEDMVYDDTTNVDLTTVSTVTQGTSSGENLFGTSGADTLYGFGGNDTLNAFSGTSGDDTLYGGTGNDTLYGGNDNDYLDGGAGDDTLNGGWGNDTYFYVSGDDVLIDGNGTDIVELDAGWAWEDLAFRRYTTDSTDIFIEINDSNSLKLDGGTQSSTKYETLRMNDGTGDVSFSNIVVEYHGSASGNFMTGISQGASVNDVFYGLAGGDTIDGGTGNDTIYGGDDNDSLTGGAGNDILDGGAGNDTLSGSGDDDTYYFYAGGGLDTINESGGTDRLHISGGITINDISMEDVSTSDAKVVVTASTDEIEMNWLRHGNTSLHVDELAFDDGFVTDQLVGYQSWLWGTSGNDSVSGNGNDNVLVGKDGNDDMDGGAGADDIHGGDGDDEIAGGTGDDLIYGGDGTDTIDYSGDGAGVTVDLDAGTATDGNSDSDTLVSIENVTGSDYADTIDGDSGANVFIGGDGDDDMDGKGGTDRVSYSLDAAAVTVNLSTGSATDGNSDTDTLANIENVTGSDYNDTITGSDGANSLDGGAGNDNIVGGAGDDALIGGTGDDTLNGGDGTDTADYSGDAAGVTVNLGTGSATDGNSDTDTLSNIENARGSDHVDTLTGSSGANMLYGGASGDTISGGAGADYLLGEAGDDTLNGGDDADYLSGGDGADDLNGGAGDDVLYGGDGGDTLHGDADDDVLYGMDGLDTLYGDGGADTFVFQDDTAFNDIDVIKDFDISTDDDVLDISNILDLNGYEHGVDTLTDWVEITTNGSDSDVKVDITGTGTFGGGTQIATLEGITGLTDEAALVTSGNLLVA